MGVEVGGAEHSAAVKKILDATKNAGKVAGIFCASHPYPLPTTPLPCLSVSFSNLETACSHFVGWSLNVLT
jgi:hypothetical protein